MSKEIVNLVEQGLGENARLYADFGMTRVEAKKIQEFFVYRASYSAPFEFSFVESSGRNGRIGSLVRAVRKNGDGSLVYCVEIYEIMGDTTR